MEGSEARRRVEFELDELRERISRLDDFLVSEKFRALTDEAKYLLKAQRGLMVEYGRVLDRRLEIWID